jgi:hypothetical protein
MNKEDAATQLFNAWFLGLGRHSIAEQSAAADGGLLIGFPSIKPSRPPLLSCGVRRRRARMGEGRTGLLAALRSLLGKSCERSLATNSLKLRFDGAPGEKGRAYIWIDPPWRLSLAGRIITGSADRPVWDGVEEPEVNRPLWEAWCALFDPLNRTTLVDVAVGSQWADLTLEFETGHRIDTFGNSGAGYWWYYRDCVSGEVFEVGAGGIAHEWAAATDAEPDGVLSRGDFHSPDTRSR